MQKNMKFVAAFLCLLVGIHAADVDPVKFLEKFGYMNKNAYASELPSAITEMQKFAGLPVTGKLDAATLKKMGSKRCGRPDIETSPNAYAAAISKWGKTRLTYQFLSYCKDMSRDNCRREIRAAFTMWERVTPLRFSETSSRGDITIKFESRHHGDNYPFDGNGGVLAHAFYPSDGRAHFDEDEHFVLSGNSGTHLFWVAAHEFGHSLGLSHSNVRSALMYPYYQVLNDRNNLPLDDCKRIQNAYGRGGGRVCGSGTGGGMCEDDSRYASSCNWWRSQGYCRTSSQYYGSMKTLCTKTCGLC